MKCISFLPRTHLSISRRRLRKYLKETSLASVRLEDMDILRRFFGQLSGLLACIFPLAASCQSAKSNPGNTWEAAEYGQAVWSLH